MAEDEVKVVPPESSGRRVAFSSAIFHISAEKGTRTFYVHGDILSQYSQPFKSIVDGRWEESVKREIKLEEWDGDTVSRMIDYLYTNDYTWQKNGNFEPAPIAVSEKSSTMEYAFRAASPLTPLSRLIRYRSTSYLSYDAWTSVYAGNEVGYGELFLMHAKVYALANYRAIEKLSELALDRLLCTLLAFQATEYNVQQIRYIMDLVSYVYKNTCWHFAKTEPMRRVVARFIALELTKLNSWGAISFLMSTYGDFASDLLSDLTRRIKLAEVGGGIHKYLAGLEVHTGGSQPSNCVQEYQCGSPNINFGKNAEPVWLVPYYTEDVDKACTSFRVIKCGQEGYNYRFKILAYPDRFRCLISVCDQNIRDKVSHVLLLRAKSDQRQQAQKQCSATGIAGGISGTRDLCLMWK